MDMAYWDRSGLLLELSWKALLLYMFTLSCVLISWLCSLSGRKMADTVLFTVEENLDPSVNYNCNLSAHQAGSQLMRVSGSVISVPIDSLSSSFEILKKIRLF